LLDLSLGAFSLRLPLGDAGTLLGDFGASLAAGCLRAMLLDNLTPPLIELAFALLDSRTLTETGDHQQQGDQDDDNDHDHHDQNGGHVKLLYSLRDSERLPGIVWV
jgi:hypothetical protein